MAQEGGNSHLLGFANSWNIFMLRFFFSESTERFEYSIALRECRLVSFSDFSWKKKSHVPTFKLTHKTSTYSKLSNFIHKGCSLGKCRGVRGNRTDAQFEMSHRFSGFSDFTKKILGPISRFSNVKVTINLTAVSCFALSAKFSFCDSSNVIAVRKSNLEYEFEMSFFSLFIFYVPNIIAYKYVWIWKKSTPNECLLWNWIPELIFIIYNENSLYSHLYLVSRIKEWNMNRLMKLKWNVSEWIKVDWKFILVHVHEIF